MSERTRKVLIYGGLVLAIFYAAYNFMGSAPVTSGEPLPIIEPLASAPQPAKPRLQARDLQILKDSNWGRDPFAQSKQQTTAGPKLSWTLKGIVYNPSRPLAFINGMRVGIGDTVNSAKVITIDKTKVTLVYQGTQFDVYVQKG
jgi:type II secretory pathway component PulC